VAITGMGGQGKSALAGHYLDTHRSQYHLWDWRDCREEADTLHTQLVAIIQRATGTRSADLAGEQVESLVRNLFAVIGQRQFLFVFDNIDQYVDLEECKPIGGMRVLMDAALRIGHRSRFIFTCRPPLVYDDPSFLHLPLRGFSETETLSLFEKRDVSPTRPETRTLIVEAHVLTHGHPMWLNLIATQVSKNRASLGQLVSDIRRNVAGDLPIQLLRRIWKSLPDKQVYILRCLGEAIRPQTEERLEDMVASEVTRNQLARHLRALRLLDLVVAKATEAGPPTIELHPLIKQFVTTEYPKAERGTVINVLILYYDKLIARFGTASVDSAPYSVLEHWLTKAELACNCGRYNDAAKSLRDIGHKVCERGFPEEFIRVSRRLFDSIDWVPTLGGPINDFD